MHCHRSCLSSKTRVWAATRILCCLIVALLCGCKAYSSGNTRPAQDTHAAGSQFFNEMADSAETAAARVVTGHRLWVTGQQADFSAEAIGRAGGLMMIDSPGDVASGDVVLAGFDQVQENAFADRLAAWKQQGVFVVAFAPDVVHQADQTILSSCPGTAFSDSPASVRNLANLWAWTAEFSAACTRLDKMPVHYESFGMPGGRERAAKYADQKFHNDMKIPRVPEGTLSREYFAQLESTHAALFERNRNAFSRARRLIQNAGMEHVQILAEGHIWTSRFGNGATPIPPSTRVVIHLSYQEPPEDLIARARREEFALIYCSVRRGQDNSHPAIIYIDPCWSRPDGCVTVSGYDVPILPQSGVVQSWILNALELTQSRR